MEAVVDNDMDEARSLLTQGKGGLTADPNFSDEFGFSCLHVCAKVSFRHFLIPCSFSVLLSTYYRHALSSLLPPPSSLLAFYLSLFLCLHKRHFNPGAPLTLNCLQVASFTVLPSGSCSIDSLIAATEKNDERKKWLSGAKPDGAPAAAAVAGVHVATLAGKRVEALSSNAGRSGGGGKLWIEGVHRGVIWVAEQVSRKVSVL